MSLTPSSSASSPRRLWVATVALLACAAACPPRKPDPTPVVPSSSSSSAPAAETLFASVAPGARVAVLYTASVQGYVEPCGCTAEPLGGVARFRATVDAARAAYGAERVLVLDAGDLLFEKLEDNKPADRCQAEARVELLLDSYAKAGVQATVRGPLDDVRGAAFRDEQLKKHGLPSLDDGSRIFQLGAASIGVVAFRVEDAGGVGAARARVQDQVAQLLASGANSVVALAQAPRPLSKAVAQGIAGLDVVIQGRAPGEVPLPPEPFGAAQVLVASGQQAQYLGVLEFDLEGRAPGKPLQLDDRAGEVSRRRKVLDVRVQELAAQLKDAPLGEKRDFLASRLAAAEQERDGMNADALPTPQGPRVVARAIALPRKVTEEPSAAAALAAYRAAIPSLVARCEQDVTCAALPPGQPGFVGAQACKACHESAWAFWQQQSVTAPGVDKAGQPITRTLGHASAWDTLAVDGKQSDRSCVGCHSTGFDVPGGPCKSSEIAPRGLQGVQCESCHGAGSVHSKSTRKEDVVRKPVEATCRGCHQVPHIETTASFVFEDKLKLITGPGHGGMAR